MEQNTTDTSKLCKGTSYKKVIKYAEEANRLSNKEEYKPLYEDGNFLELANPDEPHTSKMIAAILNYEQNGEHILFKSFVRRFLSPIGLEEEWIKNPDIQPEKDCMDIRILDEKYAILFESKLKGADFQRNQLGKYIYKLNHKQYNGKKYNEKNIFIVLIPGHISNDFINEIPKSVWKRPQDFDHSTCATNGNQTTCWCAEEESKENCKDTQNNDCTKYFEDYLPHTIVIDKSLAEWILSAAGLVESKQMPLISSMTLFANYIKKLYNINYPDKFIMQIKNYLEKTIFDNGLTAEHKLDIAEQELSNVDAVQEALTSIVADLKVDVWYDTLNKDCPKVHKTDIGVYFLVKVAIYGKEEYVEIGCWNGIGDDIYGNSSKQYWAIHCVNANREEEQPPSNNLNLIFQEILKTIGIEGGRIGKFWIKWNEWNDKKEKGEDICRNIYKMIEIHDYPKTVPNNTKDSNLSVNMSILDLNSD